MCYYINSVPGLGKYSGVAGSERGAVMSTLATKTEKKKKSRGASTGSSFDNLEIFLLHLPTTIWYLLFCYAPMYGVTMAERGVSKILSMELK